MSEPRGAVAGTPAHPPPAAVGLVREWAEEISGAASTPMSVPDVCQYLQCLTERWLAALVAPRVNTVAASDIGAQLVADGFTGPHSLSRTVQVLAGMRPGTRCIPPGTDVLAHRVAELLGALVAGYVEALRYRLFDQLAVGQRGRSDALPAEMCETHESVQLFDVLFDSAAFGIAISGPDGRIVRTNPALSEIFGHAPGDMVGRELTGLFTPDIAATLQRSYHRLLSGAEPELRTQAELRRRDGETTWIQATVSALPGASPTGRHLSTTISDVTELQLLKQRLNHQVLHDVQTGLPNRQYFVSHLEEVLGRLDPSAVLTLLHLDLDGFSVVNDGLGHRFGDQLLNVMARRLESVVGDRRTMVARVGGDEFAVLIEPGDAPPEVGALAEAINTRLAEALELDGLRVAVTATIGVVQRQVAENDPAELLRAASATLGRLRDKGRRQWALFDPEADAVYRAELQLAAALPGALESGELQVRYRPVVALDGALDGDRLVGVEAMLVWEHPQLGELCQERCMQLAERTGVVHAIGQGLLYTAAVQARLWQQQGGDPPPIMINLSLSQAQDPDLVAKVRSILGRTGIGPAALELGVPVSAIRKVDGERSGPPGEEAEDNLRVLAELGVRTALHDFGGDIGALVCLTEPWVHAVRIAQVVSTQLSDDPAGIPARALRALLSTMRAAEVTVMACAVDDEQLATEWRAMGADCGAGALFGHACAPGEFEHRYVRRPAT
ncbi:MAG: putative bifunctional diguanylate cyclase/phosphodiesterase [Pseudonocardiaceae bacterium]